MRVDYWQNNHLKIIYAYALPRIDDIFSSIHNASCFVALDLLMGYHQIPIPEEDPAKTAVLTHKGLYVFNVMPFEMCTAPKTLQRLMDAIFRNKI